MSAIGVLGAIGALGGGAYQEFFYEHQVVVASSPANAEILIDGMIAGKTPLTLELKKGTYTLSARKEAYETLEHAVYVSRKKPNIVNLQLIPTYHGKVQAATKELISNQASGNLENLAKELASLKSLIIASPEEAATVPILNERMRTQSVEVKALREEIKGLKDQSKWYLGSMIAMIIGLLGVIATLFVANKGK